MRGPAIVFDNVSLQLGGTQVLDEVSFRVEAGALHCLVGPNGGGKTSLVRSLLGQMPHSGSVRFEGKVTTPMGYVPQFPDFDRNVPMTVNDVMALLSQRRPAFLGSSRSARAANAQALEQVRRIAQSMTVINRRVLFHGPPDKVAHPLECTQ
ncbi:hypothetical protein PMI21_00463 [Pseudomonas sp. GM18]|nr:hypothetical protein PMI21_00463 [Pseudomonas sp. GM18]